MLQQILLYGNTYTAIEHTKDGSAEVVHILQLFRKKSELLIKNQASNVMFEEGLQKITTCQHAFLIVNNQQVLVKELDIVQKEEAKIVGAAFPNVKRSDFYVEVYTSAHRTFVAICRKEYVDNLIAIYAEKGIMIVDFSLGNLAVQYLIPYLNEEKIFTSNAKITTQGDAVVAIEKQQTSQQDYSVNGLKVTSNLILSLGGILGYYIARSATATALTVALKHKLTQERFWNLGKKIALLTIFLILLVNFLFFNHYHSKVNRLEERVQLNTSYKQQLQRLHGVIDQKEKLVNSITSASQSKISWYMDAVAKTVPNTILLNEMNFQPLIGAVKKRKEIKFEKDKIIVEGSSKYNADFTNWIATLEKKTWIKNITIVDYKKTKKGLDTFVFVITKENE